MSENTKIQIRHRSDDRILFEVEAESVKAALLMAIGQGVDVKDADLSGANLSDANLSRANLSRANLSRANLSRANLSRANLSGANLSGANLSDANLSDANLSRANLSDAYLSRANLSRANLSRANLSGADLSDADLSGAYLSGTVGLSTEDRAAQTGPTEPYERLTDPAKIAARARLRNPEVPVIENLDAKILAAIGNGGALEMGSWHTCDTTHCRAGWAIHLAGEAGHRLESLKGAQRAGTLIYEVSTGRVPHFFASNERALEDIRKCAAQQTDKQ